MDLDRELTEVFQRAGEQSGNVADLTTTPRPAIQRIGESKVRPRYRVGIVGRADTRTPAGRVYPRDVWATAIKRSESQIPAGKLGGAVDNAGPLDGGNMRDRCILWKSLAMDSAGVVSGEFLIASAHSTGADLIAWIDAGGAVGFQTVGYARTSPPTQAERERYGLAADDDSTIVRDFELVGINAVDPMHESIPAPSSTERLHACLGEALVQAPEGYNSPEFDADAADSSAESAGRRILAAFEVREP